MIDRATLPVIPAHTPVTVGQQFTITGQGFDSWPSEVVLGFAENNVENTALGGNQLMRLVSKTDSQLVFEILVDYSFADPHTWQYFGAPFATPRSMLAYEDA